MNAIQETRPSCWGVIGMFSIFSEELLVLTILEKMFHIIVAHELYGKIIGIPVLTGLLSGFVFGGILNVKFSKMKKELSDSEMKRRYHKEVFCAAIISFISIGLFGIAYVIHIVTV